MATIINEKMVNTKQRNYYQKYQNADEITINGLRFNRKESDRIGIALISIFRIEKLFNSIINITTEVLETKSASLMILEEKDLIIKSSKHIPEDIMKQCRVRVGSGISGWVALKGKPLLVKDIENNTMFGKVNNKRYSTKSFVSVPIINNDKVIGVINASDKNNNEAFTEEDLKLLMIICQYSTIAIRNALLIQKTKRSTIVEELDSIYNNSDNKFLPVTLKSLKSGPFSTSELYLENNNNGKKNYVLYWKGKNASTPDKNTERLFNNEKREEFIKKNINRLYVLKNGRTQYLRFVETKLSKITEDKGIGTKEKLQVINDVAHNIVKDVSTATDGICNIERTKHWVDIVIDFVLKNKNNTNDLIMAIKNNSQSRERFISVTELGIIFAKHLGLNADEINKLGLALFFQDIGMYKIAPSIINKTGRLSKNEFAMVKKHPEAGFQILQDTGLLTIESFLTALQHHENFDGSGYPYGLKGNDIDYYSRISRVIDVYDTLTFNRPYATANTPEAACKIMKDDMKSIFDTDILNCFIDFLKSAQIINNVR